MDELTNKISKNDLTKMKRYIVSNAARELSALSEPCYYPKTKKTYYELLNILKITDKDVKAFIKRTYKGTKAEKWNLWRDPTTNFLVVIMHLFLKEKDVSAFKSTLVYYMIIQYSRLMHKQMKYCDPEAFKYTLDNMTRTHLFFREKTIPSSLYYLTGEMEKTFKDDIGEWNLDRIILFIGAARHRISQSVKSFAESYYRNKKDGAKIKTQNEEVDDEGNSYQHQTLQRGQKIVDDTVKKIITYKVIDRKAFDEAKKRSKIKTSIATLIVNKVGDDKNADDIRIALQLFIKNAKSVGMICGEDYFTYVKRLMALKRTNAQLYFKAQINILLLKILKEIGFTKTYESYTSQTQFIINTFLAYYLTMILRNTLC